MLILTSVLSVRSSDEALRYSREGETRVWIDCSSVALIEALASRVLAKALIADKFARPIYNQRETAEARKIPQVPSLDKLKSRHTAAQKSNADCVRAQIKEEPRAEIRKRIRSNEEFTGESLGLVPVKAGYLRPPPRLSIRVHTQQYTYTHRGGERTSGSREKARAR